MMIDDKYLRILAAIYYLSRQNPTIRQVHSNQVEALLARVIKTWCRHCDTLKALIC